jgi:hypothetical protein
MARWLTLDPRRRRTPWLRAHPRTFWVLVYLGYGRRRAQMLARPTWWTFVAISFMAGYLYLIVDSWLRSP